MFVWGPLFRKRVVTASIGTYIRGVLVNDGYLCSRVYGITDKDLDCLVHTHRNSGGGRGVVGKLPLPEALLMPFIPG